MCDTISAKMYSLEFVQLSKVLLKYFKQATLQFAIALLFSHKFKAYQHRMAESN